MRKFEKISLEEYNRGVGCGEEIYNNLKLPRRATRYSAGYDIHCPINIFLPAKGMVKVPTLLKVDMDDDDVLIIDVRSSLGFKHNVRLCNTIPIIDKDYYNNPDNEGHIFLKFYNPNDYDIEFKANDRIAQGIFLKYGITVDDEAEEVRNSGLGSTGV